MKSAMKMHKCPEIIAGANFSFETVKLCILIMRYAYYVEKIPSSDEFANIPELLYTFYSTLLSKNYYNLGKLGLLTV
jgi:hypothetical protein